MNKIIIIGNLVRDPELRTTPSGVAVCTFTIAVNGRKPEDTQFFRITTWRQTAENCQRFLAKGRKVAVTGAVSLNTYTAKDGTTKASLEVNADEVEFLTPKTADAPPAPEQTNAWAGFVPVDDAELPF
jgi:single-strand DNA-binding protein